jgi:lipid-binding SYLF domain-containing protein
VEHFKQKQQRKKPTMKKLHLSLLAAAFAFAAPTLMATEQDKVDQATTIIHRFTTMAEKQIPRRVLRDAKGIAIVTVVKGGFIWSGRIGEGVVLARTAGGWSGPAFIRTGGAGFGAQIGGKVTEFVFVLNTPEAVKAFSHGGNVEIGGALSATAGPVGRSAEADVLPTAAIYTYSRSQGLFAGASIEGTVILTDESANARYYQHSVTPNAILSGRVAPPKGASQLARSLGQPMHRENMGKG